MLKRSEESISRTAACTSSLGHALIQEVTITFLMCYFRCSRCDRRVGLIEFEDSNDPPLERPPEVPDSSEGITSAPRPQDDEEPYWWCNRRDEESGYTCESNTVSRCWGSNEDTVNLDYRDLWQQLSRPVSRGYELLSG